MIRLIAAVFVTRASALALSLVASGFAVAAYADDEYGTGRETVTRPLSAHLEADRAV